MTIQELKDKNLIVFEAITGSKAYGTNLPTSDTDLRGIFILPETNILGMNYVEQVNDQKNDIVYYEIKRFLQLLRSNNPTILELLFTPSDCVQIQHPVLAELFANKMQFLTQKCRYSFGGYAVEQIKKARGLNKKIVRPIEKERKGLSDFCWIPYQQGSISLAQWLKVRQIEAKDCGLSGIDHAKNCYHLFVEKDRYKGITDKDDVQILLSEIAPEAQPEAILYANIEGFQSYCKEYREYWDWVEKRNETRYNETLSHGKNYDGKNMMHCHRLLDMCVEIAQGQGISVRRPNREQLLAIRRGDYDYDLLLTEAEEKIANLDSLFAASNLPADVSDEYLNELLIRIRRAFYK